MTCVLTKVIKEEEITRVIIRIKGIIQKNPLGAIDNAVDFGTHRC